MRKSKLNKSNKNKRRKDNKRAVIAYDGHLGELVGDTYREKNTHLNTLINIERVKLKKETKAKAEKEGR